MGSPLQLPRPRWDRPGVPYPQRVDPPGPAGAGIRQPSPREIAAFVAEHLGAEFVPAGLSSLGGECQCPYARVDSTVSTTHEEPPMPGNPPPFDNETDGILLYLIQQRDGLTLRGVRADRGAAAAAGHDPRARSPWAGCSSTRPSPSGAGSDDPGGCTGRRRRAAERRLRLRDGRRRDPRHRCSPTAGGVAARDRGGRARPARPRGTGAAAQGALVPRRAPGASERWILLHLIEEMARHAGHADIVRESSTARRRTS